MRDAKLRIEEGESRTAGLEQELKDAEQRKRKLEEDIGFLNTECARLSELEELRIASMNQGKKVSIVSHWGFLMYCPNTVRIDSSVLTESLVSLVNECCLWYKPLESFSFFTSFVFNGYKL